MTTKFLRISRPCYDKYHRCPGWAGGGVRYAKIQVCDNGSLTRPEGKLWKFKFNQCRTCKVFVWPYYIRWADWRWLKYVPGDVKRWYEDRKYWRAT